MALRVACYGIIPRGSEKGLYNLNSLKGDYMGDYMAD